MVLHHFCASLLILVACCEYSRNIGRDRSSREYTRKGERQPKNRGSYRRRTNGKRDHNILAINNVLEFRLESRRNISKVLLHIVSEHLLFPLSVALRGLRWLSELTKMVL